MSIIQTFYNNLATHYDKLFLDWQATTGEQAEILSKIFQKNGFDNTARILDCACGIGTQSIGIAALGYNVTASHGGVITHNGQRLKIKYVSKEYDGVSQNIILYIAQIEEADT